MESYPTYDALALDLDLHFFDKMSILKRIGNNCGNRKWLLVVTDDGRCHLFDKHGNLDDIKQLTTLKEFYIQSDIRKIIIPDSITRIEEYVFFGCINLTSVIIPDSVTRIGDSAFAHCNSLANMTMPKSIRHVGYTAFYNCKNLKNLFFKGKTLKQVKAMKNYPWGIKDESIIKAEFE